MIPEVLNVQSQSRREFLSRAAAGAGAVALGAVATTVWSRSASAAPATMTDHAAMHAMRAATVDSAMLEQAAPQAPAQPGTTGGVVNMEGDYYKSVRLPPKANATPLLDKKQIEEFERTIACPCPCTLDVFTCRTTDFSCGNSPAVHADVLRMVNGGYSADEIMAALTGTYGNNILMAPPKKGINLIAWFAPFAALGAGAILLNAMLRGWRRNSDASVDRALATVQIRPAEVQATDAELARLQKALRDDDR